MGHEATQYIDRDGDTWTRQDDGSYTLTELGIYSCGLGATISSLARLRSDYGPLTLVTADAPEAAQYTDKDGDTWTRQAEGDWMLTAASGTARGHVIGIRYETLEGLRRIHGPLTVPLRATTQHLDAHGETWTVQPDGSCKLTSARWIENLGMELPSVEALRSEWGPLTTVALGGVQAQDAPLTREEFGRFVSELGSAHAPAGSPEGVRRVCEAWADRMGVRGDLLARAVQGDSRPERVAVGTRVRVDFAEYLPELWGKTGVVTSNTETKVYQGRSHPYRVSMDDSGNTPFVAYLTPLDEPKAPPAAKSLGEHASAISAALADAAADGFYLDNAHGTWLEAAELNTVTRHGQPGEFAGVDLPAIKLPKGA